MNPNDNDSRVHYVRVTNGLDFDFVDRFDGVPVRIPPGKSENIPPDMAWHFFAYTPDAQRAEMFRHTAKRHGWNTKEFVTPDPATRKTLAETYFDKIKIEAVIYKLVPAEPADPQAPVPADSDESPAKTRMVPKRVEVTV
jgi:hypothetical protein